MSEQLPETAHDVPRVIFAQRVVDKILRGALLYPGTETGEALIGLVVPQEGRSEPDIYVLDTIGPGNDAVREWGMFEQGDDWQGDVLHWLSVNWEAFREVRRPSYGNALAAKWDLPLMHVGDWHKQPGDMIAPSGGDMQTARLMIADVETPVKHLVAPIVTMYSLTGNTLPLEPVTTDVVADETGAPLPESEALEHRSSVEVGAEFDKSDETTDETPEEDAVAGDSVVIESSSHVMPPENANTLIRTLDDKGWIIRIDSWYMSKRIRRFIAVTPVVWPDERLPKLPEIAWHLAYPRRFDQELGLLQDAGYLVDIVRFDADGHPPYEICFSVYRHGSKHVILLVTPVDYPVQMPAVRVAPLVSVAEDEDVFTRLYEASNPVLMTDLPGWEWDRKRTLIELVLHVEKTLDKNGGAS